MTYRIDPHDTHVVIRLSGDVMGGPDFPPFLEHVEALLARGHRSFVLDLSGARWINSTGLGILVTVFRRVQDVHGALAVCGANKRIRGIYYVAQLEKVFRAYDTVDEGVAAVTAA